MSSQAIILAVFGCQRALVMILSQRMLSWEANLKWELVLLVWVRLFQETEAKVDER